MKEHASLHVVEVSTSSGIEFTGSQPVPVVLMHAQIPLPLHHDLPSMSFPYPKLRNADDPTSQFTAGPKQLRRRRLCYSVLLNR